MNTTAPPDRVDASRAALIVYDAWRARAMPIIYTTPVSRADGPDVVLLPTGLE